MMEMMEMMVTMSMSMMVNHRDGDGDHEYDGDDGDHGYMMVTMEMMKTVEQSSRQISVARATRHMSNIASSVASP